MIGAAWSARTIVKLPRPGFGQSDQILDGLDRQRWMHGNDENLLRYQSERREIRHVVRRFLQKRQNPKGRTADKHAITVRRRLANRLRCERAAPPILDYD